MLVANVTGYYDKTIVTSETEKDIGILRHAIDDLNKLSKMRLGGVPNKNSKSSSGEAEPAPKPTKPNKGP